MANENDTVTMTLIGGPTALLEVAGLRLLTDPTFSPPDAYPSGTITLTKLAGPALTPEAVGHIDAVLLSHDQHADNLDPAGRAFLAKVPQVFTTSVGAQRLAGAIGSADSAPLIEGLAPWQTRNLVATSGGAVHVTATPARHGPPSIEPLTGEVIGFVLTFDDESGRAVYFTGDSVWYEGVAEVAKRFEVSIVVTFVGAARTRGPFNLTMDADDALETARAFPQATIVPVHFSGWAHFTQSQDDVARAFSAAGLTSRLRLLEPGVPVSLNR